MVALSSVKISASISSLLASSLGPWRMRNNSALHITDGQVPFPKPLQNTQMTYAAIQEFLKRITIQTTMGIFLCALLGLPQTADAVVRVPSNELVCDLNNTCVPLEQGAGLCSDLAA